MFAGAWSASGVSVEPWTYQSIRALVATLAYVRNSNVAPNCSYTCTHGKVREVLGVQVDCIPEGSRCYENFGGVSKCPPHSRFGPIVRMPCIGQLATTHAAKPRRSYILRSPTPWLHSPWGGLEHLVETSDKLLSTKVVKNENLSSFEKSLHSYTADIQFISEHKQVH